jgi:phosphatidate cytidylyltransferase
VNPETRTRLFGFEHAFDHPVTTVLTLAIVAVLIAVPLVFLLLQRFGRVAAPQQHELWKRYLSWLVLVPVLLGPVLLGAFWTIALIFVLSLLCYREYARATGLFREKLISFVVVLGIIAITFAALDHWYGFFVAIFPLTVGIIALSTIVADQPKGYIQRVALGVLGFALFGSALGHLSYMANDKDYRPQIIMIFVAVEANDVFGFVVGKTLGRWQLAPNTSPKKTVAGAAGALVLTTILVAVLGHYIYEGTPIDRPVLLVLLGAIISIVGQMGDLMLSSVKRDLGIKDFGTTIPGHGGLLDRFDSLILVAPAVFHYVGFFVGFGLDQQPRIFTGD